MLICFLVLSLQSDRNHNVRESLHRTIDFAKACRAYSLNSEDNSYPSKLTDIIRYLEKPDLTDAWGNPFRYALIPNPDGVLEPYIWSERVQSGRVTLHGVK